MAQDCDPGAESRYRLRADCGRLRRSFVRGRSPVRLAALAGLHRLRRFRRHVPDCNRRRDHQQCARRSRRIRIGAAVAVPIGSRGPSARRIARLPNHLLSDPLRRGAGIARRARVVGAPCPAGAVCATRAHLARHVHASGKRDRRVRCRRGAAFIRGDTGNRPSARCPASLRAVAGAGAVASARQRGGRRPSRARERAVPQARCGVVSDHVAVVRRHPAVTAQGI